MNRKLLTIAIVSLLVGGVYFLNSFQHNGSVTRSVKLEWSETIKMFATELADDKYEGRNAGYPGNDKAAEYIALQFKKAGLIPMGNTYDQHGNLSYLQKFEYKSFYTGSKELVTANVIGMIEGIDPALKHEIVVIGAHFDHIGRASEGMHLGRDGDKVGDDDIFNGADDNASGTSAMMTIAYAFKSGKIATKRSLLFIAFSAEEAGLHGSQYYCLYPTTGSIRDHVFMVNLDMVGRNPTENVEVNGYGTAIGNTVKNIVSNAAVEQRLLITLKPGGEVSGGDSDHSSFGGVGIPFIFFFTGFHPDYHRVTDHSDKLSYEHIARIAKTAAQIIVNVANLDIVPKFNNR